MINLFPAYYLRPTRTAGSNEGNDAGSENEDADADDSEDADDTDDVTNDNNGHDDADAPNVYLEKSQDMRKAFLREFSGDEVADMWQVHNFMVFTSGRVRNAAGPALSEGRSIQLYMSHGRLTPSRIPPVERSLRHSEAPSSPSVARRAKHAADRTDQVELQPCRRQLAGVFGPFTREKLRRVQGGRHRLGSSSGQRSDPGRHGRRFRGV